MHGVPDHTFIIVLIVAGTLVAGLIVGAQRDAAEGPVDLIITNGRVYTAKNGAFAEAVAVRGNKILRVGSNREIKRLRRPQTVTVDAHGATVLPGFNDSHIHLLSGGLSLSHLDLLERHDAGPDSGRHRRLRRLASRTAVDSAGAAGTTSRLLAACPRASSWTCWCPTGRRT